MLLTDKKEKNMELELEGGVSEKLNKCRPNSTGLFSVNKFMKKYLLIVAFLIICMLFIVILNTNSYQKPNFDDDNNLLNSSNDSVKTEELQAELDEINKNLTIMVIEKKREDRILRAYEEKRSTYLEKTINRGTSGRGYLDVSLKQPSGLTAEIIDKVLEGTPLEGLGNAYIKAEKETGVSALFLIGVSVHESKWGKSEFARERNNIFGYKSYDSDPDKTKRFSSKEECIAVVAKHLGENYLNPDGKYYSGATLKAINKRYASDKTWYIKVNNVMEAVSAKVDLEEEE